MKYQKRTHEYRLKKLEEKVKELEQEVLNLKNPAGITEGLSLDEALKLRSALKRLK